MYANCLVVALLQKIKDSKTELYFIKPKINPGGHCHVMWKDGGGRNYHFTSDDTPHGLKVLLFRGYQEELPMETIERFRGVRFL